MHATQVGKLLKCAASDSLKVRDLYCQSILFSESQCKIREFVNNIVKSSI